MTSRNPVLPWASLVGFLVAVLTAWGQEPPGDGSPPPGQPPFQQARPLDPAGEAPDCHPAGFDRSALTLDGLVRKSREELEALYRESGPGTIPEGYACGKSITYPGTALAVPMARVTGVLWRGKVFDPAGCTLVNQWCGFRAVRARVAYGPSWLDGNPSIIMDYLGSSRVVWADVRDEMREVAPGLFLGIMYRRQCPQPKLARFFALQIEPCCGR